MYEQRRYFAIATLLVLAGACESGVEPEADAGPGEPVPFPAVMSEGEVRIGPPAYLCGQWHFVPLEGHDLYLDLIGTNEKLGDLTWFTDRGAQVLYRFEASDVLSNDGAQVRIRLPRDRMDEWRRERPPMSYALGVVNLERHDVVFRGRYHGDESELRETVTAAGGVVVGRLDITGPTYTIILPDTEMKSFAEGLGARFDWMDHRGFFCIDN